MSIIYHLNKVWDWIQKMHIVNRSTYEVKMETNVGVFRVFICLSDPRPLVWEKFPRKVVFFLEDVP